MSEKTFRLAEVAKNNDSKKTWLVIHNGVYDVTAFLNEVNI
jgi:cytochrome b involved in lipid metabolism